MSTLLFLFSILTPVCCTAFFLFGIRIGRRLGTKETDYYTEIRPLFSMREKHQESEEERKKRIIYENIENFGTDIPQQEVE